MLNASVSEASAPNIHYISHIASNTYALTIHTSTLNTLFVFGLEVYS